MTTKRRVTGWSIRYLNGRALVTMIRGDSVRSKTWRAYHLTTARATAIQRALYQIADAEAARNERGWTIGIQVMPVGNGYERVTISANSYWNTYKSNGHE